MKITNDDRYEPPEFKFTGLAVGFIPVLLEDTDDAAFAGRYRWCEPLLTVACFVCNLFGTGMPIRVTGEWKEK